MISPYFHLIKPRIILGNLITAACGFAWASKERFDFSLFFSLLIGLACIIGSAAALNNWIDRGSDAKMQRTKKRPLVTGVITPKQGFIFAISLGLIGLVTLTFFTNFLAASLALFGLLVYVALYTLLKYRTPHATLIGSIAGAMPPLVGYATAAGFLNGDAIALFLLLFFWQMPHFYAFALYRSEDYRAASIPVLPVLKGSETTKQHIFSYILAFAGISLLPGVFGKVGVFYWAFALGTSAIWLFLSFKGFRVKNDLEWGRSMFRFSLVVILVLMMVLSMDGK